MRCRRKSEQCKERHMSAQAFAVWNEVTFVKMAAV
jgi:hypothetical protein